MTSPITLFAQIRAEQKAAAQAEEDRRAALAAEELQELEGAFRDLKLALLPYDGIVLEGHHLTVQQHASARHTLNFWVDADLYLTFHLEIMHREHRTCHHYDGQCTCKDFYLYLDVHRQGVLNRPDMRVSFCPVEYLSTPPKVAEALMPLLDEYPKYFSRKK